MKSAKTTLFVLLLVAGLTGSAQATHFAGDLVPTVNCDGWTVDGAVFFGTIDNFAIIEYTVVLSQNGAVVAEFADMFQVDTEGYYTTVEFTVSGTWPEELCGDYTVAGNFDLTAESGYQDNRTFSESLFCDCPGGDCFRTPGFWKNHPEDWAVIELTMGDVTYTQDEALVILRAPVRGDATVILAHHLIAAKLNVFAGAANTIQDAIDAGDAFLAEHGYGSRPGGEAKQMAIAIKNDLAAYNEQGCDGEDDFDVPAADKAGDDVTESTWSAVKQTYR